MFIMGANDVLSYTCKIIILIYLLKETYSFPGVEMLCVEPWEACRSLFKVTLLDFPGGPVVKTPRFHGKGAQVRPLVGKLRSRMPRSAARKTKTNKQK